MENKNFTEINLLPFYAAALAHAPNIKGDIERLYSKKAEEYYMAAKDSEFYECYMCKRNSLVVEELFKKSLGFFCYAIKNCDEETRADIYNLFKKAYRKTYRFFKDRNLEELSGNDYLSDMDSYFNRLSDDVRVGNIAAFMYFSGGLGKELDTIVYIVQRVWEANFKYHENFNEYMKARESEVNILYKGLPSNVLNTVLKPTEEDDTGLAHIYISERIKSCSIFSELQLDKRDIKEVIFTYIIEKQYGRKCDFETYILFALHLKAMCKAYNKVKEMYFENNKETMYVEMGAIKKELQATKAALESQKIKNRQLSEEECERNQRLLQENAQLQKQIKRLQSEMSQMESDSKEAAALRDYVFSQGSLEPENDEESEAAIDFAKLDNLKGVIIGGFPGWQNRVKDKLRSWQFVNAGVNTLDKNLVRNSDVVVFNTKYLNHDLYYKIVDMVRNSHTQIRYINNDNVLKGLESIYKTTIVKAD